MVNEGAQEVLWEAGQLVASYGKGKFQSKTNAQVDTDKDIPYTLEGPETLVILSGRMTTLKTIVAERQATHPTCTLCYHKLEDSPTEAFKIVQEHTVVFTPANVTAQAGNDNEEGAVASQSSAAALLPWHNWQTSMTNTVWAVQWKAKGLMPIRPQVVFTVASSVGPGRATYLSP